MTGAPPPVLLKLGGALITDKAGRNAVRRAELSRAAAEVAAWRSAGAPLVVGHGSGSFGHRAVADTGFLDDPADPEAWALVAEAARRLNVAVVGALLDAGVPATGLPGLALVRTRAGEASSVRLAPVEDALAAGIVPVVYGDVVYDEEWGGAVASTELLLAALAPALGARRIVLATDVDGVMAPGPQSDRGCRTPMGRVVGLISPATSEAALAALGNAPAGVTDVTGAMAGKVRGMLQLVAAQPQIEVRILSGARPGAIRAALAGDAGAGGTVIAADANAGPAGGAAP